MPLLPPQPSGTPTTNRVSLIFIKKSTWIYFVPWRSFGEVMCLDTYFLFKDDGREMAIFKPNRKNFLPWNFKHYVTWVGVFLGERLVLPRLTFCPQITPSRQTANLLMLIFYQNTVRHFDPTMLSGILLFLPRMAFSPFSFPPVKVLSVLQDPDSMSPLCSLSCFSPDHLLPPWSSRNTLQRFKYTT